MKKIITFAFIVSLCSIIHAEQSPRVIRGVEFEPTSPVTVANFLTVDIPAQWDKETLSSKANPSEILYIFSKRKPTFAPSLMIAIENDDGSDFEKIRQKYMPRVFGNKASEAVEKKDIMAYMDKSASRKIVYYGSNFISGNTFFCLLNYKKEKKTVVLTYNLVYQEKFPDDEWLYVTTNSLTMLISVHKK